MSPELLQKIRAAGVIPVVALNDAAQAVDLAQALLAGGIPVIEMTLRTEAGLAAIRRIASEVPEMILGAGTILSVDQVKACADAGATFAVAPGCDPAIVQAAQSVGLAFAPGVMTPSDIASALNLGCRLLKYFPAETAGGVAHLKALAAPHAHLGVQFIPTGGIHTQNLASYLQVPAVVAAGGSWLTPKDALAQGDWAQVTELARAANAAAAPARA